MGDDAETEKKFAEAEIVPNIIPEAPKRLLKVNYEGTELVPGVTLKTSMVRFAPRITFEADPEAMYTLVMIDPDNLSRKNPSVAEWLHWLVVNIPASNLLDGIMGGQVLMAYGSPGPQPRTDLHRYIILLYEHAGKRISQPPPSQRAKFKVKLFQEKHGLGCPIAGNFFLAKNESG
ncbi:unnamed protein product [Soboliphyme baturini]|uniref:OV-16 antigen n=1 Tax=Soboliphyme baturini TaxID=241478 RepID=A0A183IMM3_9BILA|nr:unnamed protein product [Soboliphyme baturini]